MLRSGRCEVHMPLQGTSKNRPRVQQIAVWSSSYLQPTTTHYLDGVWWTGLLAQLFVSPQKTDKKKRFIFRPFNFCCWHTLSSAAPAWRVSQVFLHGEFWQLV